MPRCKEFDTEEVLEKAMDVFWRKGFECTSVQDLVDAMGINRFSIYDTFGNKEGLFQKCIDHYAKRSAQTLSILKDPEGGMQAIISFQKNAIDFLFSCKKCQGCMITNASMEMCNLDKSIAKQVKACLKAMEDAFATAIKVAQSKKEVCPKRPIEDCARFLATIQHGMVVMSKSGASKCDVEQIAKMSLEAIKI